MAPAEDDEGTARAEGLEEGEPEAEEEDYEEAVTRHAKYLGIDPDLDAAYIWIAEEVGLLLMHVRVMCLHRLVRKCKEYFHS